MENIDRKPKNHGRCIYCLQVRPLSRSHIIPECLGGLGGFKMVCESCNSVMGDSFEAEIARHLSFYRYILNIKTKGKKPRIKANISILGKSYEDEIEAGGFPRNCVVIHEGGSIKMMVGGPTPDKAARLFEKYRAKGWEFQFDEPQRTTMEVTLSADAGPLADDCYKRLAAKISFERFCQIRKIQAYDREFESLRAYVLGGGIPSVPIVFLIVNEELNSRLLALPFPFHGIFVFGFNHASRPFIGAVVTFFGVFNYFVILSKRPALVGDWMDYCCWDPRRRKIQNPILRRDVPLKRIVALIQQAVRMPEASIVGQAKEYARNRLNKYMKAEKN